MLKVLIGAGALALVSVTVVSIGGVHIHFNSNSPSSDRQFGGYGPSPLQVPVNRQYDNLDSVSASKFDNSRVGKVTGQSCDKSSKEQPYRCDSSSTGWCVCVDQ